MKKKEIDCLLNKLMEYIIYMTEYTLYWFYHDSGKKYQIFFMNR